MAIGKLWAGRLFGTHTGNVFVKLSGPDNALTGTLRFAEDGGGIVVYQAIGNFDGTTVSLRATVALQPPNVQFGDLTATATLRPSGGLAGEWETAIGSGGTFVLHPHDDPEIAAAGSAPEQHFTAHWAFGPIDINRDQIIGLADEVQRDFPGARVIVTIANETAQSRYLDDFRNRTPKRDTAKQLKLYVAQSDNSGSRTVTVDLGQSYNSLTTAGVDEAWVLGTQERLKNAIRPLERRFTPNGEWHGIGIRLILVLLTLTVLPSLDSWFHRVILLFGLVCTILAIDWCHRTYLPNAAISLAPKSESVVKPIAVWLVNAMGGAAMGLLTAYLKGFLKLP